MARDKCDTSDVSRWRNSLPEPVFEIPAEVTSSHVNNGTGAAADGLVKHLGSELPEAVGFSSDEGDSDRNEKYKKPVQNRGHHSPVSSRTMDTTSQKPGRLKRPSQGRVHSPSYLSSDHDPGHTFVQKRIPLPRAARPSIYDIEDSPQKLPHKQRLDAAPIISPLRRGRRPVNAATSRLEQVVNKDPDGTTRHGADDQQAPDVNSVNQSEAHNARRSLRNRTSDVFPASSSIRISDQERRAAIVHDADGGSEKLFVDQSREEEGADPAPGMTSAKKELGRPLKSKCPGPGRPRNLQQTGNTILEFQPEEERQEPTDAATKPMSKPMRKMIPKLPRIRREQTQDAGDDSSEQLRAANLRVSEVVFSGVPNRPMSEDHENPEAANEHANQRKVPKQSKQRQQTRETQVAGKPSKRQKLSRLQQLTQSQENDDDNKNNNNEAEPSGQSQSKEDTKADRLLGQRSVLRTVLLGLSKIGVSKFDGVEQDQVVIALDDEDVLEIVQLAHHAKAKLNRLQARAEDADDLSDPPKEIDQIRMLIDMLCGKNKNVQPDFKDENKILNIYFHLFAYLVRLLRHMITCYEAMDVHEGLPRVSISIYHLDAVASFICMILEMGRGAKKYVRPDSSLAIVRPVERLVLIPLRDMYTIFKKYLADHAARQQQREREALNAQRVAREEAEKVEAQKQDEKYRVLRKKWGELHTERRQAEGGIIPSKKQMHLRYRESEPEIDQNGDTFERVSALRPRVGFTPATIDEVKKHGRWPKESLVALAEGLQEWAGDDMVFERIIRQYCVRHGALNGYSVTEIVVTAVLLKEHLRKTQQEAQGWVEDWVRQIPDWTKPLTLLHEDSVEVEDGDDDEDGENDENEDEYALYE